MDGGIQVFRQNGFERLPGGRILRLEDEKQVVETGLQEGVQVFLIGQFQAIRQQAGNLADLLGVGYQGRQILAQGRLAAGKGDVRDAGGPGLIHDGLPFCGGQFTVNALGGSVFGLGPGRQAVGQGTVEPQRCSQILGMGCHPLKVEVSGRVQIRGMDGGLDALVEIQVILLRLGTG